MREVDASWKRAIEVVDLLAACDRENNRQLNELENKLFDTKAYIEEITEIIKIQKERTEQLTATDIDCAVDDMECKVDDIQCNLDFALEELDKLKEDIKQLKGGV